MAKEKRKREKIHDESEIVIGARFGRLLVTGFGKNKRGQTMVLCKCDCGKDVETKRYSLTHGQESCSCKQYEDNKVRAYKHGMGGTWRKGGTDRFYNIYSNIIARIRRPVGRSKCYAGIKCLWNSFEEFKNDMYESYLTHVSKYGEKETTIDRIDCNGDYCKENCRWATIDEQAWNKNRTLEAIVDGKVYKSCDISKIAGIGKFAAEYRIKKFLNKEWDKEKLLAHKMQ